MAVYDVEPFTFWEDNHDLLPNDCRFISGTSATVDIGSFPKDREIHIVGAADILDAGQLVRTTSTADFERNGGSHFGSVDILHQPLAVLRTPKSDTLGDLWEQVTDTWAAFRDMAQQFGNRANTLIQAVTSNPNQVFRILTKGFFDAITQFGTKMVDFNAPNNGLLKSVASWLGDERVEITLPTASSARTLEELASGIRRPDVGQRTMWLVSSWEREPGRTSVGDWLVRPVNTSSPSAFKTCSSDSERLGLNQTTSSHRS